MSERELVLMDSQEYVSQHYMEGFNLRKERYNTFPHRRFGGTDPEMLNAIIPYGSKVLDFGCGNGSMGFMGRSTYSNVQVDGLDRDMNNPVARYHKMDEVKDHYDIMVFSSVLEHCTQDEISQILTWAHKTCDRIIITLPNSYNPLMSNLFFALDMSHIRPYDSPDFLYYIEQHGFNIHEQIFYNDHPFITRGFLWARRMLSALWNGTSPYGFVAIVADVRR
jgi:hypothetical protein